MTEKFKLDPTGIFFGEAAFVEHHANICIFAYKETDLAPTFLLQSYNGNGNFRGRMKADEMRNLRNALDKVIEWMDSKTCTTKEKPKPEDADSAQQETAVASASE